MNNTSKYVQFFRSVFLVYLFYLTIQTLSYNEPYFLSSLNLIFHEAGHPIFGLFGETAHFLGGTIGQLAIPAIFAIYFFKQKNLYAALVLLWWFGQNMIGISVYIKDAHTQDLPLLGNGIHDWMFLLSKWGVMGYDHIIGGSVQFLGAFIMFTALIVASVAIVYPRLQEV